MRTTLSVDDDVAAKLKVEGRLSGRPFREIVRYLEGLPAGRDAPIARPRVASR